MSLLAPVAKADIVVENDLIDPKEIYDFVALQDSEHWWMSGNVTKYYCIMRGLWNPQNHPAEFPQLARFSNPLMYSSTKQFLPWLRNRATTYGVEKVAEVCSRYIIMMHDDMGSFLKATTTSNQTYISFSLSCYLERLYRYVS
jgi:Spondin_N